MKVANVRDMVKGWFIGDFEPTLWKTQEVEVAFKRYQRGDTETAHIHRIATEFTLVASGRVRMNGVEYGPDAIVLIHPGEATDFEALEDATTVVVKIPGAPHDKYPAPKDTP